MIVLKSNEKQLSSYPVFFKKKTFLSSRSKKLVLCFNSIKETWDIELNLMPFFFPLSKQYTNNLKFLLQLNEIAKIDKKTLTQDHPWFSQLATLGPVYLGAVYQHYILHVSVGIAVYFSWGLLFLTLIAILFFLACTPCQRLRIQEETSKSA